MENKKELLTPLKVLRPNFSNAKIFNKKFPNGRPMTESEKKEWIERFSKIGKRKKK